MSRAQDRGSRFQRGSGVFKCEGCGRSTRKTAATSGHDGRLCEDCFELAGIYNVYQDAGDLAPYFGEIIDRCSSIRAKGGTVDAENAMLEQLALAARAPRSPAPGPYSVGTDTARDAAPGRVHVLAQSLTTSGLETVAIASTEANAAFIVRACNAHAELLAALRDLVEHPYDAEGRNLAALDRARAAIASAVLS